MKNNFVLSEQTSASSSLPLFQLSPSSDKTILVIYKSIANATAQQTQGLPAFTLRTAFKSCHKLVKIQLQNLDQTSAFKSWSNFSFKFLTKNIHQNLDTTSASISRPKTKFKIFSKPQLQNLDQTVVNRAENINRRIDRNAKSQTFSQSRKVLSIKPPMIEFLHFRHCCPHLHRGGWCLFF